MNYIDQALAIAKNSLRSCYIDRGIVAGPHHFTDFWARDSFFAALGSLKLRDIQIVRSMAATFFFYQRKDGMVPYRVMRGPISIGKYFGKPKLYKSPRPTYRLRGFGAEVLDGTTLTILFATLVKETQYLPNIKQALLYLTTKEKYNLLWDGPMGEWNDAVWKYGNLLYSNIIYWYMYDRLANWTIESNPVLSHKYSLKANLIAHALRTRLWNGEYFADWHDYKRQDYFYPFGNCLAIIWGLTTPQETESILAKCNKVKHGFTLETNHPKYPWWRIDLFQRAAGMADYQNQGIMWWQPITAYLAALRKAKKVTEANKMAKLISHKVINDRLVYECYERSGHPVTRPLYTAEHPFAWAAGMLIWSLAYNDSHE